MCLNGRNLFFRWNFLFIYSFYFAFPSKDAKPNKKFLVLECLTLIKIEFKPKKGTPKKKSKGTHNYGRCQNNLRIYFNTVTFVKMSVCHTDYHLWRHLFTLGRSSQRKSQQLSKCTQNDFSSSFFTRTSHCNGGAWVLLFSEY